MQYKTDRSGCALLLERKPGAAFGWQMKSAWIMVVCLILSAFGLDALATPKLVDPPKTYCNPMNLDYAFVPDKDYSHNNNSHRSTADPVCIMHRGIYYLFATNQEGYWWSKNMASWHFVPHLFKVNGSNDQVCAPAAWPTKRGVFFLPCFTEFDTMPLYVSKDPRTGKWAEAVESFPLKTWDPGLFEDDDGKFYVYWGSSNLYPIYGAEIDPKNNFQPIGKTLDLLKLDPKKHGWEQFGQNNQNGKMDPFMEGAWMNKFGGKYYLQYGAPGTEWNVYGDGVYVSDKPLGPFKYQEHNPFSWKPGGFACGAGHGSTFEDEWKNLWHIATMVISVKNTFERRLGLFPSGVDKDGVLFTDTAFGDYPHYLPVGKFDPHSTFAGWMLLSYKKKCWASSGADKVSLAFDENIKTSWAALDGKKGQFLAVDLGSAKDVRAIQVNYADLNVTLFGKQPGIKHQYKIWQSDDGKAWRILVDKSNAKKDVPHDYLEFAQPVKTRFLKLENISMPTGNFAISDFRVFGKGPGAAPEKVQGFKLTRDNADRRNLKLEWQPVASAYAYELSFGVSPEKLYSSVIVYDANTLDLHSLNVDSPYYFKIQSVSEAGVSQSSDTVSVQ